MADAKLGSVLYTPAVLNIIALNINGLRTKRKKDLLEKLLEDLRVGVGIISETHLRKSDLKTIKYRNYHVVADYCRKTPVGEQIRGGVLIIVHNNFTTDSLPKNKKVRPTIESCSCRLYPTKNPITAIDVVGVYITPNNSKKLTLDLLNKLYRGPQKGDAKAEDTPPILFGGDFNTTSWPLLYEEWLQSAGLIDLVDPEVPTYAAGTAIDKFLFAPGRYIPSTFLPSGGNDWAEDEQCADTQYYPAAVLNYHALSDHLPVALTIPCDEEERSEDQIRSIRVKNLTDEDWEQRNADLQDEIERVWPKSQLEAPLKDPAQLYKVIVECLNRVFHRERKPAKPPRHTDPFERFLLQNICHPEMAKLLTAMEEGNALESDKYIRRIGADGWRKYLQSIKRHDARALFAYLAKSEGRKQKGFVPADASPMIDQQGCLIVSPKERVQLITRTFRKRFAAPAVINPALPASDPNNVPLKLFRRENMGEFLPLRLQEMVLAIAHLSSGKSPGPDGVPVEIFKRLSSLQCHLLALLNAIYHTGDIPKA